MAPQCEQYSIVGSRLPGGPVPVPFIAAGAAPRRPAVAAGRVIRSASMSVRPSHEDQIQSGATGRLIPILFATLAVCGIVAVAVALVLFLPGTNHSAVPLP